jgi:hypothetical protein
MTTGRINQIATLGCLRWGKRGRDTLKLAKYTSCVRAQVSKHLCTLLSLRCPLKQSTSFTHPTTQALAGKASAELL